jgi:hypothetical protein
VPAGTRSLGVPGVAFLTGVMGLWLAYAGIRDVPVVDGLRDALSGTQPQSRATEGTPKAWRTLDRSSSGSGASSTAGVASTDPASWAYNLDPAFAGNLKAMAAASGGTVILKPGGGWRSAERQIELRRQHCGTSEYAIYQMPSSSCHPPTARPGNSNHEKVPARAFDLTYTGSGKSWARLNAARFGITFPMPTSEPWHAEPIATAVGSAIFGRSE